ncbi:3-methyl-2-oxobutanoate hydroxymethyltransferase [Limihaloglobus sulfuriphilus]|uniref:3-methyl-2-oxobutanoate hydroxymethyltransferase n=1 Tax=Limihaloglobus sulfuriphilus TaxID=1851148 RepID=A0A1Q2MFR5_9BACT|nr:3-methyl-2-oxobutanoate hydroxymethyltransferase [Limihaloglobus sulfuriphilus]AQQ71556.1 3-methyl-2-oxobutanoate hydroxymethyltransferase [Limihaloglobus sulfuriphilus]
MNAKKTLADLYRLKENKQKFSCITCYDYTTASIIAGTDIDTVMVGDSAAQAILGHRTTLPADMDTMVKLTAAVRRGLPESLVIADMPFLSYQISIAEAIRNAGRFITEAGADIVKIEVSEHDIDTVRAVSRAGIAVMAHIGIRPQSIGLSGRLRAEGTTAIQARGLIDLAQRMVDAGARMLLVEGTAREIAAIITRRSRVPVLSCGSGPDCDGQVLVITDVLGLNEGAKLPKFAKCFGRVGENIREALTEYDKQVKNASFPDDATSYHIPAKELEKLNKELNRKESEQQAL